MATVVRELVATFELDVDEGSFKKAESSIDQVIGAAKILGAVFITGAVAAGFKSLIERASDATENLNLLEVVFGERLLPTILDWAGQTARAVNQSEFELRQFVGTTQAMLAPMLGGADAAARFSTELVEAAIDLESLANVPLPQAMAKIQSALVGQSRPLLNLGIDTREAAFDQFLFAEGIAASSQELNPQRRNLERVRFVLEKLKFVQGDAARTANDFKNVSRGIASAIVDITTRLGQQFLPALNKSAINTRRIAVATRDWIELNKDFLQQNIGDAFGLLVQVMDNVVAGFRIAIVFVAGLVDNLSPLQKGILGVTAAIVALIAIMSLPFAPIIALIALIGLIIDDLVVFGEGGKSVFGDLVTAVSDFVQSSGVDLDGFFKTFSDAWAFITNAAQIAWDFIGDFFKGGADTASSVMGTIQRVFKKGFEAVSDFVGDIFSFDADKALEDFKAVITKVRTFLSELLKNPLIKVLLTTVGVKFGAQLGAFVGQQTGVLLRKIIPKGRIGRAVTGIIGFDPVETVANIAGGLAGRVIGGVAGGAAAFKGVEALSGLLSPAAAGFGTMVSG